MGPGPLQAAILKIKGTKAVHSRRNQAARPSYESILGCHTLECSAALHRTVSSAHQSEKASFSLLRVQPGAVDTFRGIKTRCSQQGPPSPPLTGTLRVAEHGDPVFLVSGVWRTI